MGYGKKSVKGVRKCIIKSAKIAERILTPVKYVTVKLKREESQKIMNKIGYVMLTAGFFLLLCAAGGSDLERMGPREIVITSLIGIGLMIAGDVLKDKKRTIRRTIASKANCSK